MYMIMGGTGHVGSAVAAALLRERKPVTVLTRDAKRADKGLQAGAHVAEVDINEVDALHTVLRRGRRAQADAAATWVRPPAPAAVPTG